MKWLSVCKTLALSVLFSAIMFLGASVACAHPLGNFTTNHFTRIEVGADRIKLHYVIDMAEIPTFQELQRLNGNGNSAPSKAELDAYAARVTKRYSDGLLLFIDDARVPLRVLETHAKLSGAGGLQTMRLECDLVGAIASSGFEVVHRLRFEDQNYSDRIGWREVVVSALVGTSVFNSSAYGNSITDELNAYRDDMFAAPLDERAVDLSFTRGGIPAGAQPLLARDGRPAAPTRDRLAELIAVPQLTVGVALFGLLIAVLLGGLHALSPGHGKTVVGAYLVGSRGNARHALFLGLTVTITHTAGVFALGVVTLLASQYVVPEQLFPVLSLLSGAIVVTIGASLLIRRVRAAIGWHSLDHADTHRHDHDHTSDPHLPHSHGGRVHSHLPPGGDGSPVTWRSLLALGISGGILPCPSALVVLLAAISLQRVGYGLLLVIAFSAGLAGVLTTVGLAFVYAGRLLKSTGGFGKLARVLPVLSALVITCAGIAICYQALGQAGLKISSLTVLLPSVVADAEPSFTSVSALGVLGLGLLYGLKHATEVDHIVAVSAIVSEQRKLSRASIVGGLWGAGHTASLVIVGALVLSLRIAIPELVASWLEFGVALMIIGLGVVALRRAFRSRPDIHIHKHDHGDQRHAHIHFHEANYAADTTRPHSHSVARIGLKPMLVGAMHGLAGSSALTLLVLTQIHSSALGFLYLGVFGAGSIVGMLLMSGLVGLPFVFSSQKLSGVHHRVQMIAAAFSIGFGIWYACDTGRASGLMKSLATVWGARESLLKHLATLFVLICMCSYVAAQTSGTRTLSGVIVTQQGELLSGVTVTVSYLSGEQKAVSDGEGRFQLTIPNETLTARIEGKNIKPVEKRILLGDPTLNLKVKVEFIVPTIHESVVITATALDPAIDRRNNTIYKNTLFSRDDQLLQTLSAGINVGQHEGGGKSLEVRRFGYNLDHGGLNGGLKVLVDNVQQNHATQGHGQGYLGQLKSLTPELLEEVDILNGPFNAQYGDFSGLGVVHLRLRESLPDQLSMRFQGGSFDSRRMFLAYSPQSARAESLIAYEKSYLDGPFINPARYKRDNLTGNYTYHVSADQALGFKLNLSRNDFFSSGQIPLDQVMAGRLDRFGFIDPNTGGRVRSGTLATYYRKEWEDGSQLKLDGFLSRSLFDLYSNFTFFLNDQVNGDVFVQHDSRLQAGGNVQYIRPHRLFGQQALLIAGGNIHAFQTNVRLAPAIGRTPIGVTTDADAKVTNTSGYLQQGIDLFRGRLHVDLGLRYDYFRFNVDDKISPEFSGARATGRIQPKVNISYTPSDRIPATLYFNYGRGINSQDARGVVRDAATGPAIATTDFYQVGTSHTFKRMSLSTDLFLIDHSNEQVYIPDDGSIEFAGPSRSYGYEVKSSMQITSQLAFTGGITRVMNAFLCGTLPRVYIDSSPHLVSNGGLTLENFHGFSGALQWRHVANYRLDGEDAAIRASGLDVVDLSVNKRIGRKVELNFAVDNLFNKHYFETQNYFESRLRPGDPVVSRIHGTPGYPIGLTIGLTFRLSGK